MLQRFVTLASATVLAVSLTACHVSTSDHGDKSKVDIDVPFASMHVNTSRDASTAGIGLAMYPGAVPARDEDNKKDKDAADINMSFGDFHLGVKAASYFTHDSADKVEAFYRNDMKRYGDVIKCQGDKAIGSPSTTSDGLSCSDNEDGDGKTKGVHLHGSYSTDEHNPELRAGSPQHQHIVGIESKDGGTKIALVMLDLPKSHHHSDSAE